MTASSTRFSRPTSAFDGNTSLSNYRKYQLDASASPKVAISSSKIDGDFNYVIDGLNTLDDDIQALAAGSVPADSIDDTKLRNSVGTSVIGRSASTTGDPADIQATADNTILMRTSGVLGFGTISSGAMIDDGIITTGKLVDDAVTLAKMAAGTADNLVGYDASGNPTVVAPGTGLVQSAGTISADVGTTANKLVQLDASGKLPAVDGSQLTNLPSSGKLLGYAIASTSTEGSGTGLIPADNSIPQITEGNEILTVTYTPTSTTSTLIIRFSGLIGTNTDTQGTIALFQDTTANALRAVQFRTIAGANTGYERALLHTMTSGTTSATTFKIRAGMDGAGTTYWNRTESDADQYGTAAISTLIVEEWA